jgi:hypothetical protein
MPEDWNAGVAAASCRSSETGICGWDAAATYAASPAMARRAAALRYAAAPSDPNPSPQFWLTREPDISFVRKVACSAASARAIIARACLSVSKAAVHVASGVRIRANSAMD